MRLEAIRELMAELEGWISAKDIQALLESRYKIKVSVTPIIWCLKALGYRYRPIKYQQLQVDSIANKLSRTLFAKKWITCMEQNKR